MSKAGLSDDVIIQQIKKRPKPLDLSPAQLIRLKTANVTDRVIQAMTDTSKTEMQPIPAAAPQEPALKTVDPESAKFLTAQCGIAAADVEIIPLVSEKARAAVAAWLSAGDCNKFAAFKASRQYYRSLSLTKPVPLPPAGWSVEYLTEAEDQNYLNIMNNAPW